jgi:hypothetical protein
MAIPEPEPSTVAPNHWIPANPWLWMSLGLASTAAAWVWARVSSEAESPGRFLLIGVGLLSAAGAVVIRLSSEQQTRLTGACPWVSSLVLRGLVCVYGMMAGTITLLLVLSVAAVAAIPWRPGVMVVLWLIVTPVSVNAALCCWRRQHREQNIGEKAEASVLLLCAAAVCVLGSFSLCLGKERAEEWATIRRLLTVMAFVSLMAAPLMMASQSVRRRLVGLLVLLHFGGICTAVLAGIHSNWLVSQLWTRIYRPYLEFMALTDGYGYYAPDPGPGHYLWFRLVYEDSQGKTHGDWRKIPDLDDDGRPRYVVSLTYQRMRTLAARTAPHLAAPPESHLVLRENGEPKVVYAEYFSRRLSHSTGHQPQGADRPSAKDTMQIPFHPNVPIANQYAAPRPEIRQALSSFVRHVYFTTRPKQADWKLRHVKVYRVVHLVPTGQLATAYLDGADPTDPEFYRPYYLGEYGSDGRLVNSKDPLLYWLMPVFRARQGEIHDYARRHAGDQNWIGRVDANNRLEWKAENAR